MGKRLFPRSKISTSTCNSKIRRKKEKRSSNNKITLTKVRRTKILSNNRRETNEFSITFQNMPKLILSCRKNSQSHGFLTFATFLQILSKK